MDWFIDDVIRPQNKSKFWKAIALSIFDIEKWSKAQNVGIQVSVSHTDQQILASTQSPIALSFFLCVSVYVCHDVCPDDITMKGWCHTNNILEVYSWGCLVVQVMFHAPVTSLMTSPGHKVSHNFKSPSIFELERRSKLKISKMLMAIFLVSSTSGITSGKKRL